MMSKFVDEWFATGSKETSVVKNVKFFASIPTYKTGENQTPKPLFPSFSTVEQSEPDFLPKYLSLLEKKFQHADSINRDGSKKESEHEEKKEDASKSERIIIDYERKNIFLSRVKFNLFEIPDSSVLKGSEEYRKVLQRNEMYQNAQERREKFPESFIEQSTQTHFLDTEDKEIETDAIVLDSKSCLINNYVFKEKYLESEMESKPTPKTFSEYFASKTKFGDYDEFLSAASNCQTLCQRVQEMLYATEKALDYNSFSDSILKFNGTGTDLFQAMNEVSLNPANDQPADGGAESSSGVFFKRHLTFRLDKMKSDYAVTCIECNPSSPNIFVAGYGVSVEKEMEHESRGMVLCWNINKSGYPEKIYRTKEIVTCLEFSRTEQYLVAVGMRYRIGRLGGKDIMSSPVDAETTSDSIIRKHVPDRALTLLRYGLIALFQLHRQAASAVSDNSFSKSRPNGTVKSVRWFKKKVGLATGSDTLLSMSSDGVICQWTPGKHLEGSVLRSIKRGSVQDMMEAGRWMVLAVNASGTCMEFKPDAGDQYLIGTMEGEALLANTNDQDSYDQVFKCHRGVVLDLQWSPFATDVFMTTGIDRDIHVWQVGRDSPRKSLQLKKDVFHVVWSRTKSTVFAALSRTDVLVFDLSVSPHNEVARYAASEGVSFSSIHFCPGNSWVLVGLSDGSVELLELGNIPEPEDDQVNALKKTFISDE